MFAQLTSQTVDFPKPTCSPTERYTINQHLHNAIVNRQSTDIDMRQCVLFFLLLTEVLLGCSGMLTCCEKVKIAHCSTQLQK